MTNILRSLLASLFFLWSAVSAPAMLMVSELHGFNAGASDPPVLTRTGGTTCTNNADPYDVTCTGGDLTAIATGTAAADRYTCAAVAVGMSSTPSSISGVTLGGVSMTRHEHEDNADGPTGIFCLANPTGTTAAFTVSTSGGATARLAIEVYSITGLSSTTPVDSDGVDVSAGTAAATISNFDVASGGVVIAIANRRISGTVSWSGTAGASEDTDQVVESANTVSTALLSNATAITGGTVVATFSATTNNGSLTAVSFR